MAVKISARQESEMKEANVSAFSIERIRRDATSQKLVNYVINHIEIFANALSSTQLEALATASTLARAQRLYNACFQKSYDSGVIDGALAEPIAVAEQRRKAEGQARINLIPDDPAEFLIGNKLTGFEL